MANMRDKSKPLQRPRGTHDILPAEGGLWEKVRQSARELALFYGFEPIETPHFEDTDLFTRGVGPATDIVAKQLYSFKTRGGDALTLRPEGTAAIARAHIEHGMMNWPQPVKLHYLGSFFRHEAPQRGRFREFHQWGIELLGEEGAVADAEVIHVSYRLLGDWGLEGATVEVNSVGCPQCRPAYRNQLLQYYRQKVRGLCRDCKDRFRENPLRLLDCTQEKCVIVKKAAPQIIDRLCEACKQHFRSLLEFLEEIGIPYALNPHLVRGLDYYTRTVFETFYEPPPQPEASSPAAAGDGPPGEDGPAAAEAPKRLAIVSGGRYDGLIEAMGGKPTPAVGAALGLERFVHLVRERKPKLLEATPPKVFLVQLGELAKKKSFAVMEELRRAGISMAESLGRDAIRSQLKIADRVRAPFALIIGQKEALDGTVIVRDMSSGIQETVSQAKLAETLKRKLKR